MPVDYWPQAISGLSKQDSVRKALIRSNRKKRLQGRGDPLVTLARDDQSAACRQGGRNHLSAIGRCQRFSQS
jgi:hypothetical protein